jgi:hypothetical protein
LGLFEMKKATFGGLLLLGSVVMFLGCATNVELVDYAGMENVSYAKPGLDLSQYRQIMFGALEVDIIDRGHRPEFDNLERLRKLFRDALYRELQQSSSGLHMRFVDQNARDVVLVKARLTGQRTVTSASSAFQSSSGSESLQVDGSLALEVTLLDSMSGERLLSAIDDRSKSRQTESSDIDWVEASAAANTWAKSMVRFLDNHLSDWF